MLPAIRSQAGSTWATGSLEASGPGPVTAGQLAGEMGQRSWLTCDAKGAFVFETDEASIWARTVKSMGKDYEYLLNAPVNPQWN